MSSSPHLLEVRDLRTEIRLGASVIRPVDGVSFHVDPGETLGIVGESGSGKSMTALSVLRLLPRRARTVAGSVTFRDRDLLKLDEEDMREVRGGEIAMIFQDPMTSLNPVFEAGWQVAEPLRLHRGEESGRALKSAVEMLRNVGIPQAERRAHDYPHQFSGGMRQRAMIGMGLTTRPALLIADEPTTALDVTIQAQILDLLRNLNREFGAATVLITHNLGVVAGMCDRVLVMYAGRVVEEGPTASVFEKPRHPYTWSLLRSLPRLDATRQEKLRPIEGQPPDLARLPAGCKFQPRCPFAVERCLREDPELLELAPGRRARCWVTQAGTDLDEPPQPRRD